MVWLPCNNDNHDWEPVRDWTARYRCTRTGCGVLGYRSVVNSAMTGKPAGWILAYRCPKCHGPTTAFRHKKVGEFHGRNGTQLCPSCKTE